MKESRHAIYTINGVAELSIHIDKNVYKIILIGNSLEVNWFQNSIFNN